jgi:hypothetical protein
LVIALCLTAFGFAIAAERRRSTVLNYASSLFFFFFFISLSPFIFIPVILQESIDLPE